MKPDQLNNANNEKLPAAFNNLNHSGTSYAQHAIEHVTQEISINEEAAENLVRQVMQHKARKSGQ